MSRAKIEIPCCEVCQDRVRYGQRWEAEAAAKQIEIHGAPDWTVLIGKCESCGCWFVSWSMLKLAND